MRYHYIHTYIHASMHTYIHTYIHIKDMGFGVAVGQPVDVVGS